MNNYNFIISIIAPLNLFFSLNLRNVLAADHSEEHDLSKLFRYRFQTIVMSGLIVTFIFLLLGEITLLAVSLLLFRITDNFFDFYYGVYQRDLKMNLIAYSQLSRGFITVFAITALWVVGQELYVSFIILSVFFLILNIIEQKRLSFKDNKNLFGSFNLKELINWIITLLPLGIVAVIDNLAINIPKYLLKSSSVANAVGIYSALTMLLFITGFMLSALCNSILPSLAKKYSDDRKGFIRLLALAYIFAIGISVVMIVGSYSFGEHLLRLMYSNEIAAYKDEFFYLMLAGLFSNLSTISSFVLYSMKIYKAQLYIQLTFFVVVSIISLITIPSYGINGAILAYGVGHIVRFAANFLVCVKQLNQSESCSNNLRAVEVT